MIVIRIGTDKYLIDGIGWLLDLCSSSLYPGKRPLWIERRTIDVMLALMAGRGHRGQSPKSYDWRIL